MNFIHPMLEITINNNNNDVHFILIHITYKHDWRSIANDE